MQATERKAESLLAEIAGALREAPDLDESFAAKLTPRSAIKLQPGGLPGGAGAHEELPRNTARRGLSRPRRFPSIPAPVNRARPTRRTPMEPTLPI